MVFVSVRDLRTNPARVWRELSKHGDLVVTSNGRPVAIMTAASAATLEGSLAAVRRARAQIAVSELQRGSMSLGKKRLSPERIQTEIAHVRKQRRK